MVKSKAEYDTRKYKRADKRCTYCRKCTNIRRAEDLEKQREKHRNCTTCPNCKELKFDLEHRIINKKYPWFSTSCIEYLDKNAAKWRQIQQN